MAKMHQGNFSHFEKERQKESFNKERKKEKERERNIKERERESPHAKTDSKTGAFRTIGIFRRYTIHCIQQSL
jgi:hypothetical protein